jgi:hypothetical protein
MGAVSNPLPYLSGRRTQGQLYSLLHVLYVQFPEADGDPEGVDERRLADPIFPILASNSLPCFGVPASFDISWEVTIGDKPLPGNLFVGTPIERTESICIVPNN